MNDAVVRPCGTQSIYKDNHKKHTHFFCWESIGKYRSIFFPFPCFKKRFRENTSTSLQNSLAEKNSIAIKHRREIYESRKNGRNARFTSRAHKKTQKQQIYPCYKCTNHRKILKQHLEEVFLWNWRALLQKVSTTKFAL